MGRRFRPLLSALSVAVLATAVMAPAVAEGAAPILFMEFAPDTINLNGTSTLTFTIVNPEPNPDIHGIAFTDVLPAGLNVVNHASTPVCGDGGGNLTTSGGNTIAFTRALLVETATCQFSVTVTGTTVGVKVNTTSSITSTNSGTGSPATATLTVLAPPTPPTITKAFGAATLVHGDSTSLTFTITNPNAATTLTGVDFTDTFPGGLAVAYPNGLTGSCGGGTITAIESSDSVQLAGATLAASASCTFSVDVVGAAQGTWTNTTGNVTSTEGGAGGTASATITVGVPPTLGMTFNPPTIPLNGTSELTFSLWNPEWSNTDLTGLAFTDTLPAGLTIANGSTTVCWDDGGNLTTSAGNTISFTRSSLTVGDSCSFTVTVQGPGVAGAYTNNAGPITSTNGIPGSVASAILNVLAPPAITMAFDPATVTVGGHAPLTFTLTNPAGNAADISGAAFDASLPAGLTVPNDITGVCGGALTTSGGNTISLSGATVAVGSTCTFSVDVTAAALGTFTTAGGQITSTNAGTGNTATAGLTVVAAPVDPTPTPTPTPTPFSSVRGVTAPPAAGTTPPATSTGHGDGPGQSSPILPLILLLASIIGFMAVRSTAVRNRFEDRR